MKLSRKHDGGLWPIILLAGVVFGVRMYGITGSFGWEDAALVLLCLFIWAAVAGLFRGPR